MEVKKMRCPYATEKVKATGWCQEALRYCNPDRKRDVDTCPIAKEKLEEENKNDM